MRKLFLNIVPSNNRDIHYISRDFEIFKELGFRFLLSYFVYSDVKNGDDVEFVTVLGNTGEQLAAYEAYKDEITNILKNRTERIHFTEIKIEDKFKVYPYAKIFKQIALLLKSDDCLYVDLTDGTKPFSTALLLAANYLDKITNEDGCVEQLVYSEATEETSNNNTRIVYDVTTLLYLNELVSSAKHGQKNQYDELLKMMIAD